MKLRDRLLLVRGDSSWLQADVVVCSTSTRLEPGQMWRACVERFARFAERAWAAAPEGLAMGESAWLADAPGEPGLVVTAAAGGRRPKGLVIARRVVESSLRLARERRPDGWLTVALPQFRFGAGGDWRSRLSSAGHQLAAAAEALAADPRLVVVFVARGESNYQLMAAARDQELGPAVRSAEEEALAQSIAQGECVLFVGSGLSIGAGMPSWRQLVAGMAEELGVPASQVDRYLLDIPQWYVQTHGAAEGRRRLGERLRAAYGRPLRPTVGHYALLGNAVDTVITTNYDVLIEETLCHLQRVPRVIREQREVPQLSAGAGPQVVKLHGDLSASGGFVLTRDDYDRFFSDRPAFAALLEGLLLHHHFFFVGYSLTDPNFRQVFHRISSMLGEGMRRAWAVDFEGNEHLAKQWRAKGLQLLGVQGACARERSLGLYALLDRVSSSAGGRASIYLASDGDVTGRFRQVAPLREQLLKAARSAARTEVAALDRVQAEFLLHWLERLGEGGYRFDFDVFVRLAERLRALALPAAAGRALQQALAATHTREDELLVRRLLEDAVEDGPGADPLDR